MPSKPKYKMPIEERAKQFMPFAALKGLPEALADKERLAESMAENLENTFAFQPAKNLENTKSLQQNLQTDDNQDDTATKLRSGTVFCTENASYLDSQPGA